MAEQDELTWQDFGACLGQDPDLFFGTPDVEGRSRVSPEQETAAKKICSDCPVKLHCQDYAVQNREFKHRGVWGGLNHRELRNLAKKRIARASTT